MKKTAIFLTFGLLLVSSSLMAQQLQDDFYITVGSGIVLDGGGSGYNDGEWYVYPSMWINQWFYDHPFDDTKGKIIHIDFYWSAYDPTCTVDINVAINWSTPAYSDLGLGDTEPPLPGVNEELYIVRHTFFDYCGAQGGTEHVIFDYVIEDYNPEWVSIDVMGCNFVITDGTITHECAVANGPTTWGAIKSISR